MSSLKTCICDNCGVTISSKDKFTRNFDICVYVDTTPSTSNDSLSSLDKSPISTRSNSSQFSPGRKEKKSVEVTGCSTRCMIEWYNRQQKWEVAEQKDGPRFQGCFGGGAF